ncbi:MAG: tail fiber domain-containing protein [Bacilli bacterium]
MADLNLEDIFGGIGSLSGQVIQNQKDIETMKPIVDIAYTPNNKPTVADIAGALKKTGDVMTGPLEIQASHSHIKLTETDASNKQWHIEGSSSSLSFVESGVSTRLKLYPGGIAEVSGKLKTTGEIRAHTSNAFRIVPTTESSGVGSFFRNDNSNLYLMFTEEGQAEDGTWNSLRPFTINVRTGATSFGHAVSIAGALSVTGIIGHNTLTHSNKQIINAGTDTVYFGNRQGIGNLYLQTNNGNVLVSSDSQNYRVYHQGFKPGVADVAGAVAMNTKTQFNAPFLMRTANSADDSDLRNMDYSGFYRTNSGYDVDGKKLPSLMIHCAHSSGKAHGRGIGFEYGTSWGMTTYRFDSNGVYQGQSKIYHAQDKPTAAELGVVPASDVNTTGTWAAVINKIPKIASNGVIELGRYADFHYNDSTLDYDNRMDVQSDSSMRFQSGKGYGYIDIGPKDTGAAHLYTDRPMFYFNKPLRIGAAQSGEDKFCFRGESQGGSFASWRARAPALQVDCPNAANQAYAVWKATTWGKRHFAAMDAHDAGNNNAMVYLHVGSDDTFKFVQAGDFTANRNGNFNDVYIRSDARLKTNLVEETNALDKVLTLKSYHYDKKLSLDATEYTEKEFGLIAQELEKVLPEAVNTDETTTLKTISNSAVNALLVAAVKEQQQLINKLTIEVNKLKEAK